MFCRKCRIEKPETEFHKGTSSCKPCKAAYRKEYYGTHSTIERDRAEAWRIAHPEQRAETKRRYWLGRDEERKAVDRFEHLKRYYKSEYGDHWAAGMVLRDLQRIVREKDPGYRKRKPRPSRAKHRHDEAGAVANDAGHESGQDIHRESPGSQSSGERDL